MPRRVVPAKGDVQFPWRIVEPSRRVVGKSTSKKKAQASARIANAASKGKR